MRCLLTEPTQPAELTDHTSKTVKKLSLRKHLHTAPSRPGFVHAPASPPRPCRGPRHPAPTRTWGTRGLVSLPGPVCSPLTTAMWRCSGPDHHDVALPWFG